MDTIYDLSSLINYIKNPENRVYDLEVDDNGNQVKVIHMYNMDKLNDLLYQVNKNIGEHNMYQREIQNRLIAGDKINSEDIKPLYNNIKRRELYNSLNREGIIVKETLKDVAVLEKIKEDTAKRNQEYKQLKLDDDITVIKNDKAYTSTDFDKISNQVIKDILLFNNYKLFKSNDSAIYKNNYLYNRYNSVILANSNISDYNGYIQYLKRMNIKMLTYTY